MGFFLFALVSDEPEVLFPKYSQTAIPQAAHFFQRVVNLTLFVPTGVPYYIIYLRKLQEMHIFTEGTYFLPLSVFFPECTYLWRWRCTTDRSLIAYA